MYYHLQHVQRPLLSFGPKAFMELKTCPANVCKVVWIFWFASFFCGNWQMTSISFVLNYLCFILLLIFAVSYHVSSGNETEFTFNQWVLQWKFYNDDGWCTKHGVAEKLTKANGFVSFVSRWCLRRPSWSFPFFCATKYHSWVCVASSRFFILTTRQCMGAIWQVFFFPNILWQVHLKVWLKIFCRFLYISLRYLLLRVNTEEILELELNINVHLLNVLHRIASAGPVWVCLKVVDLYNVEGRFFYGIL